MTGTPHRRLTFGFSLFAVAAFALAQAQQESTEPLETLARALADSGTDSAYSRLAEFASNHAGDETGAQAALALGHADHDRRRYTAAIDWYEQAEKSEVLREYALLFGARAHRSLGREEQAIALYGRLRSDFPAGVQDATALEEMADAALAVGQARKAIEALEGYAPAASSPVLLLVRARALQHLNRLEPAAADYAAIYYGFPLSTEAKTAGAMLTTLRRAHGSTLPSISVEQQVARAEALFDGDRCTEARAEFTRLLPQLTGAKRDRAQLRIARCRVRAGAPISVLSRLKVEDPETDAERLYTLSQTYRSRRQISPMLKAVEEIVARYPQSRWTEDALYSTGNYYWVELDRAKAADYYDQVARKFPFGRNAVAAHWRVTWTTYLEQPEQAAAKFEEHLTRYRTSTPYTENALYWLGRVAERAGDASRARAFYTKAAERFTQSYYGRQAADRLNQMGTGSTAEVELLNQIPKATPAPTFADAAPAAAEPYR
ncbi:MAG: tetratricopeptide repeat protein, partial [Candidatus Acidiferrales bacterium]